MKLTNRQAYLNACREIKESKSKLQPSLIYQLLIKINNYKNFTDLIVNFDKELEDEVRFLELFNRLKVGEPFEYVVNEAPFVSLILYVDNNVLIPRVETEGLVTIVRKLIDDNNLNKETIVDMCSGSGCIGLYMKSIYKDSKVYLTDISKKAIEVANKNSKNLNLDVTIFEGDKLEKILENNIKCDVFLSNPPYVENDNDIVEAVKKYEPRNAVYIEDNNAFYEECFKHYKDIMNEKFVMAFEINYDQKDKLTSLIGKYFKEEDTKFLFLKDIYNKDRYLVILGGYNVDYFQM